MAVDDKGAYTRRDVHIDVHIHLHPPSNADDNQSVDANFTQVNEMKRGGEFESGLTINTRDRAVK